MSCKTCLKYGHTAKRCHETTVTRARRSCQRHNKDKCTSSEVKCYHCGGNHQSYSRNFPVLKNGMEVVRIQTKECIPRHQTIRKLLRFKPHPELFYSHAVKNTSNRTTSKFPDRTDQKSQSESSEDDSPTVPCYGHGYYTQGKDQKKKSPPSPALMIGGRRVKRPRK